MKLLIILATVLLFVSAEGHPGHAGCVAPAGQALAAMTIRIYGVKINVDDMERALAFYKGKLGFEIEDRGDYPRVVVLKSDGRSKLHPKSCQKALRARSE